MPLRAVPLARATLTFFHLTTDHSLPRLQSIRMLNSRGTSWASTRRNFVWGRGTCSHRAVIEVNDIPKSRVNFWQNKHVLSRIVRVMNDTANKFYTSSKAGAYGHKVYFRTTFMRFDDPTHAQSAVGVIILACSYYACMIRSPEKENIVITN